METTTPAMFELGPKQTIWFEALESGNYKQFIAALHEVTNGGDYIVDGGHCCLGVADIVCDLNETNDTSLAHSYEELGLRDEIGTFIGPSVEVGTGKTMPAGSLTELNDNGGWTFPQIAAFIRSRAHDVFKESK